MEKVQLVEKLHEKKSILFNEIGKIIIGQNEIINQIFISMLCRGHILLEGVPGLAKTLLIKTISDVLHLSFSRIQFTPDLMPSDITGTEIIEENHSEGKREFRFLQAFSRIWQDFLMAD